ncbi:TetR/AcrR family transcriptional regulator [Actinosynnema pretiosum]|uniref:TetR family transcriptional regulator n=1 Tax=Actinosynnema pretiosum TaxID=42197 RepID=A0A290Z9G0_9PSEU|nr:TetR/AcrR family transcriptional regulator [Actinosynnema pretiosum]ATE55612.1 TetR family transcriptional regulator [Actinosynnema pretiosum]
MEPVLSAPVGPDESRSLLDAAHDRFCRTGVKRSTTADVAKLAGLSRITLHRRFATKDALFEQVVRREFRRYFDRFAADVSKAETVQDRVVEGFAGSLRAIRDNPLIGGLMSTEPDAVLPSVLFDGGRTLAVVRQFVAGRLRAEQRAVARRFLVPMLEPPRTP